MEKAKHISFKNLPGVQLVYFSHDQCQICKVLKPKVKGMVHMEYPKAGFTYVDVQKQPEDAAIFSVFTVPTIILFVDGKEAVRFSRSFGLDQLKDKLERYYHLYFD